MKIIIRNGDLWYRLGTEHFLRFWAKKNPNGWAERMPNPFDCPEHQKRLAILTKKEKSQFTRCWNSTLTKYESLLSAEFSVEDDDEQCED